MHAGFFHYLLRSVILIKNVKYKTAVCLTEDLWLTANPVLGDFTSMSLNAPDWIGLLTLVNVRV